MPRRKLLKARINEPSNVMLRALWAMGHGCVAGLVILFFIDLEVLGHSVWQFANLLGIHFASGHLGNMTLGIKAGYPAWFLITQSCLQDLAQMFYVYPFYVKYGYRQLVRWRYIGPMVKNAHETAMAHHKTVAPFGAIGLFLFVAIPSPSTGPVMGTLLGYTLGIGTGISFLSCCSAVIALGVGWYYGLEYLSAFSEHMMPMLLGIFLLVFVVGVVAAGVRFLSDLRRRGTKVFEAELDSASDDDASDDGEDDEDDEAEADEPETAAHT